MKLFIKHFERSVFENLLKSINHIDFSLFVDDVPRKQEDLSPINILVLQEPNEYFGLHDYAIKNHQLFSFILTWSDIVINNCENALFLPFGSPWVTSEHDNIKEFKLTHLCGKLLKTYGHMLRHEILNRQNEFTIPINFYKTYGKRFPFEEATKSKIELFSNSQFAVVIENTSHNGYFTEKLTDCLMLKTIPLYWGCSDIHKYFNTEAIIQFSNVDELICKCNKLTENVYGDKLDIVNENKELVKKYMHYEQRICDKIAEILTSNKII